MLRQKVHYNVLYLLAGNVVVYFDIPFRIGGHTIADRDSKNECAAGDYGGGVLAGASGINIIPRIKG